MQRRKRIATYIGTSGRYLTLLAVTIVFFGPLLWVFDTAIKPANEVTTYPPVLLPHPAEWGNFARAWTSAPFTTYLINTVIITFFATLGQVASASLVGYGFARFSFRWREPLFMLVIATGMFPIIVLLIPQFLIFKHLGWVNTFYPLIVPFYFGGSPLFIFLMRQYFRTLPGDLAEAARMDGASELRIFVRILLPLARPAVATVAILSALLSWNDYLGPLIYLYSSRLYTLALGLESFIGYHSTEYRYMMAASLLVAAPSILVFFVLQKWFMRSVLISRAKET